MVKLEKQLSGRGGRGGRRGRIGISRGCGGRRNFNSRNNQNKSQKLKFHPHGTGPD